MAGFSNGASTANEYTYDNNGNLTKDSNKNISSITYNCLNLPSRVTFSDGSTITYSYAADGTKLRTVHTISGTSTQKDYCANVVYENGVQKMLLTEEGYVDLSNSSYYYYLKDHQGNNRVVVSSGGTVAEVNHYYPFGGVFASSSNVQPYKYNGKELNTQKGLNWYDYGARHYDAALGRWFVMDPLAERLSAWSSYVYCLNNPTIFIDPNGKREWPVNETYKGYGRKHENNFGVSRGQRLHKGVDINHTGGGDTDKGAPILATHDGVITRIVRIGQGDKDAGGNRIFITSSDGTISTAYMHLNEIGQSIKEGMSVSEGQQIGSMGGSGKGVPNAYKSHLHYEVRINGEIVNPAKDANSLIDPQMLISPVDMGVLPQVEVTAKRADVKRTSFVNLIKRPL